MLFVITAARTMMLHANKEPVLRGVIRGECSSPGPLV